MTLARKPGLLDAIGDPAAVVPGLTYPLDVGDVVALLRAVGLHADNNAVRRFADVFGVPRLGTSERRVFFARHVVEVASATLLAAKPERLKTLAEHLRLELDENERVLAPMLSGVSLETIAALGRAGATTIGRRRIG